MKKMIEVRTFEAEGVVYNLKDFEEIFFDASQTHPHLHSFSIEIGSRWVDSRYPEDGSEVIMTVYGLRDETAAEQEEREREKEERRKKEEARKVQEAEEEARRKAIQEQAERAEYERLKKKYGE